MATVYLLGTEGRIKLLPSEMAVFDDGASGYKAAQCAADGSDFRNTNYADDYGWTVEIPAGYKATEVHIYSNAVVAVTINECEIDDTTTATNKGSGVTQTTINITDVPATSINYLAIIVACLTTTEIHGGYVAIAAI